MKINRRDFTKCISSIPFLGGILTTKLLANEIKSDFILSDELEYVLVLANQQINNCEAFKIFNIVNLDIGKLPKFELQDKIGYMMPDYGHMPERIIDSNLYIENYDIGSSVDWKLEQRHIYFNEMVQLFINSFVAKINSDAFNLLKYSGMDNPKPNWDKITDIYGTQNALLNFDQFESDNCNIHIIEDDNGLNDKEVVGLDLNQKNKLIISIKQKLNIWDNPTLTHIKREGFFGLMELGYANLSKDISYHIKL